MKTLALLALIMLIVTMAGISSAAVRYSVTDLGTLGGGYSEARAVNNLGQVVGVSDTPGGGEYDENAFFWENGVMSRLGKGVACGVNDLGQVVGSMEIAGGDRLALVWHNGVMTELPNFEGSTWSHAMAINDTGQVAGWARTSSGHTRACIWGNGLITELGTLGFQNTAYGINNAGQVVGVAAAGDDLQAFLWENGLMTGLGLGGALAVNNLGQIAGWSRTPSGSMRACLWKNGAVIDLGTLPNGADSNAFDINDHCQIVGWAKTDGYHAFVWQKGIMSDLNDLIPPDSDWELGWAESINERGQIAGLGSINGQMHAFLLTPIPEPATVVFVAFGFLLARRKRHL